MMDLDELDDFLQTATDVVPYIDVFTGQAKAGSVAMRHDVDHDINKAIMFASWEYSRGYKSTYFVLHTAQYFKEPDFLSKLHEIKDYGHEIGIHNDTICEAEGDLVIANNKMKALVVWLRENGFDIKGAADHGGKGYANGDLWANFSVESYGLSYEAYQLQRSFTTYISDNRGRWSSPLRIIPTFLLIHPIWWIP